MKRPLLFCAGVVLGLTSLWLGSWVVSEVVYTWAAIPAFMTTAAGIAGGVFLMAHGSKS